MADFAEKRFLRAGENFRRSAEEKEQQAAKNFCASAADRELSGARSSTCGIIARPSSNIGIRSRC